VRNYGYLLKKHAEVWALFWRNVAKISKSAKGVQICLMILLRFEEISLHCGNIHIVSINFAELWVAFFQKLADLWVQNLNQNGPYPPKIMLN